MSRRLIWLVLFALLLTPLLGSLDATSVARAQDATVETADPSIGDASVDATPTGEATDTATPDATATEEPAATETPTDTASETPTGAATDVPTEDASPVVTETPTEGATETPVATPSASPTATKTVAAAGLVGSLDDVSITLNCTGSQELIRITYSGPDSILITGITTLADTTAEEPFTVNALLRPSRPTAQFSAGADAVTGTVLTTHYIFTNSKYDQDGVGVTTNAGTIEQTCPAKPAPIDPVVANPGKLSDISITLSCRTYAETIRVTNNGTGYIRIKGLATDYAPIAEEPFAVNVLLRPGKTAIFQAGDGAKYGTVLTTRYIFTNSVWDQDGIRVNTSAGKARQSCEAKPAPPEHWVEVNLSMQYLWAYEGNTVVNETYVSTGKAGFETPTGTFYILVKYEYDDMAGCIQGECYNLPAVPNVMYFTNYGHALHGTYWHNNFGTPMSHGCVNLPLDFAAWLFDFMPYGGRVVIHY